MTNSWLQLIQRGFGKPPAVVAIRAWQEVRKRYDRSQMPWRTGGATPRQLLDRLQADSLEVLWTRLGQRPFAANLAVDSASLESVCPGALNRILHSARQACEHRVDLLGMGETSLGMPIDWHQDFKTGFVWPVEYFNRLDCQQLDLPCDVKVPWEISRLQWLVPVGQAFLLTRNEDYAEAARDILSDWIEQNPCLYGVNWACTMEAALRIFVWTWLFHVFHESTAWRDAYFRSQFLTTLYSHGEYTDRYLELSDLNTNHCTADASALVFAGLFFNDGTAPQRWRRRGWRLLSKELFRQTTDDGVNFEGSVPYHRLVTELFLWPAAYRLQTGRTVPPAYRNRLWRMADFIAAYTNPRGEAPQWGDHDDARVLPFTETSLSDHRYLPVVTGLILGREPKDYQTTGPVDEVYWMLGTEAANAARSHRDVDSKPRRSCAFPAGGYYVLQNTVDHVFIDCAPVGQGGRGGHGHNDCLSFEATLDGVRLIVDPGAFIYTGSCVERNRFRSTAYHNTPQIDGEELNRFVSPRHLWTLQNDAIPIVSLFRDDAQQSEFAGGHTAYQRLVDPVQIRRRLTLDHQRHRLQIRDEFTAQAAHTVEIPLHLAPQVTVEPVSDMEVTLRSGDRRFRLTWDSPARWDFSFSDAWISPSYGRRVPAIRLAWRRSGPCRPLTLCLEPWANAADPLSAVQGRAG